METGLDLPLLCNHFPALLPTAQTRTGGITAYQLQLPTFPPERGFNWAELRIPKDFPKRARAYIQLSPDAVLRIPHIDSAGILCMDGDPGAGLGYSAEERILFLLETYVKRFLNPWLKGDLDDDFETETLNYWSIEVTRAQSHTSPVRGVWTVDPCPPTAKIRHGLLLLPNRIVIAADEQLRITNRVVRSMGELAQQRIGVLIAEIPISHVLTPATWPRSLSDLDRILSGRLSSEDYLKFQSYRSRRGRSKHRLVLLRNADIGFAYLLPGGPPTVVDMGDQKKTFLSLSKPLPLSTSRLDPSWTSGRDQHPEIAGRQVKHVLVLGVGALGSPIVDHLAKAGVGLISVVDDDSLSSANIGRHLLGAESIDQTKVSAVARRINAGYPATEVVPYAVTAAEWLKQNSLAHVDAVLDLTGEPDVRIQVEHARQKQSCPLLIGWMEPYVAAAHACYLPKGQTWLQGTRDPMSDLEAVVWPPGVIRQEPGCSSRFQSYTAAPAEHAVALVAEFALEIIDIAGEIPPTVRSWIRGQRYLDRHWPGLSHKSWARVASEHDGLLLTRSFP